MRPVRGEPASDRQEPEPAVDVDLREQRLEDLDPHDRGTELKGGVRGIVQGDGG